MTEVGIISSVFFVCFLIWLFMYVSMKNEIENLHRQIEFQQREIISYRGMSDDYLSQLRVYVELYGDIMSK